MLFVAVSAVLAAPAAAAPTFEDIQVGSVVLRVPYPQGYCKPTGEQAGAFQEFAANDHDNVTLLTLVQCDPEAPSQGYLLIKTPVRALNEALDRDEAIKELTAAFEEPDMKASFESGELQSDVAKTKSARTATEIKIKGEVGPRGHDEMCVYLGGLLTTSDQDASQQQALGSCMTVLGSRFIALHAYENSNDPGAYRKLLGQMKQWALQIRKRD